MFFNAYVSILHPHIAMDHYCGQLAIQHLTAGECIELISTSEAFPAAHHVQNIKVKRREGGMVGGVRGERVRHYKLNQPLPKHDCLIVSQPKATTEHAKAMFPLTTPPKLCHHSAWLMRNDPLKIGNRAKALVFPHGYEEEKTTSIQRRLVGPDGINGDWGAWSAHAMAAECWQEELEALPTAEEHGLRDRWHQSYSSIGEELVWPLLWLQSGPLPLCKLPWQRKTI